MSPEMIARLARRDAVHKAFGSPPVTPSMFDAIESAFVCIEEHEREEGERLPGTEHGQDLFVAMVMKELQKASEGSWKVDWDAVRAATERVRNPIPF